MKNWKTTLSGILAIAAQIAHFIWPDVITHSVADGISVLATGTGLVAAKDKQVTGGSVQQ